MRKGYKHSEETIKKIKLALTGRLLSKEHKKKLSLSRMGHFVSEETKRKIGLANKGKEVSKEVRKLRSEILKGKLGRNKGKHWKVKDTSKMHHTSWNKGLKGFLAGEGHYNWIKDRSKLAKHQERNDMAYKEWRLQVYKRDNFKCRIENQDCSGRIIAHHILPWSDFPELRYNINNGITLCQAHHPRKRAEEKRLIPFFIGLVPVSNELIWQIPK